MKAQLVKQGRQWSLYSVLITALVYSALTLRSEPAYASTCCEDWAIGAEDTCAALWQTHVVIFLCDGEVFYFECANGWGLGASCP